MGGMQKTSVYLTATLKDALERLAKSRGTSEADVIREAIEQMVERVALQRPRLPITEQGLGDATIARRVDEILGKR